MCAHWQIYGQSGWWSEIVSEVCNNILFLLLWHMVYQNIKITVQILFISVMCDNSHSVTGVPTQISIL